MKEQIIIYQPIRNFILRTPLLPYSSMKNFMRSEESLLKFANNALILESIYIASPSLYNETIKVLTGEIFNSAKRKKVLFSIAKYLLRLSTRCTPFGIFAGCVSGNLSEKTNINLKPLDNYKRLARLDMDYLCQLIKFLSNYSSLRDRLNFYPNNSIYQVSSNYRFTTYNYKGSKRRHKIVEISKSPLLNHILHLTQKGITPIELSLAIVNEKIQEFEAKEFINKLIDSQFLVSEIEPQLTGKDILTQIIESIKKLEIEDVELSEIIYNLEIVNNILININLVDNKIDEYIKISIILKNIPITFDIEKLIQVDLFTPTDVCELDSKICLNLGNALKNLAVLSSYNINSNLSNFVTNFVNRYGDQEVPLPIVMDPDTGIGFPVSRTSNISDNLFNEFLNRNTIGPSEIKLTSVENYYLTKYISSVKEKLYEIEITDNEIDQLNTKYFDFPESISIIVKVFNNEKIGSHQQVYIQSVSNLSSVNLMGRFCHIDENILSTAKSIANKEMLKSSDTIIAEVVHLPESRVGNVLKRPSLYHYEIPFLANSSVDPNYQIDINDLMISVRDNKIYLRSNRFNKRIIPRLSCAHNFGYNSLPIYHFLCEIQYQEFIPINEFNWGNVRHNYKFLPRVKYKNIILHLATWTLAKNDFMELLESDFNSIAEVLFNWRNRLQMPRYVALSEGDNNLVVDLECSYSTQLFIHEIRNYDSISIVEFLFNDFDQVVKNEKEKFTNEFILSFTHNNLGDIKHSFPNLRYDSLNKNEPQSRYFPSDYWIYFKVYCSENVADIALVNLILPLATELYTNKLIAKWFFIRYSDPETHLRIRFLVKDKMYHSQIYSLVNDLFKSQLDKNSVYKILIDTYDRELIRYGPELIESAESIFYHDSVSSIGLINELNKSSFQEYRWLVTLKSIDYLLKDFAYSIEDRQIFVSTRLSHYENEGLFGRIDKVNLDKEFRVYKNEINRVLDDSRGIYSKYIIFVSILNQRSINLRPIIKHIIENSSYSDKSYYVYSYIHMSINRLLQNNQNTYEILIYYFLQKHYISQIRKNKFPN